VRRRAEEKAAGKECHVEGLGGTTKGSSQFGLRASHWVLIRLLGRGESGTWGECCYPPAGEKPALYGLARLAGVPLSKLQRQLRIRRLLPFVSPCLGLGFWWPQ